MDWCFRCCLGCQLQNGKDGVHFTYVPDGRASGEAFIDLASSEDIKRALAKNKQHMGKRYIDGKNWRTRLTFLFRCWRSLLAVINFCEMFVGHLPSDVIILKISLEVSCIWKSESNVAKIIVYYQMFISEKWKLVNSYHMHELHQKL